MIAKIFRVALTASLVICTFVLPAAAQESKEGMPQLQKLVAGLQSKDKQERAASALGLRVLKSGAKDATPALLKAVKDEDADVRADVVAALGLTRSEAPEVLTAMAAALEDGNSLVAQTAATALVHAGHKSMPFLRGKLKTDDLSVVSLAAYGLWCLEEQQATLIPYFVAGLKKGSVGVRAFSATCLGQMPAKEALADLTAALKDGDPAVVVAAVDALKWLGPDAISAAPDLCEVLVRGSFFTRRKAMSALSAMGPKARPVVAKYLKHENPEVRVMTADLLAALGVEVREIAPYLVDGLKDQDAGVKMLAAYAVARIGPKAKLTAPYLANNLMNILGSVQLECATALVALGSDAGEPLLTLKKFMLEDFNLDQRTHKAVVQIVIKTGPRAVPTLQALTKEKTGWAKLDATAALAGIQGTWKPHLPLLIGELEKGESYMRALGILEDAGPAAAAAIPAVIKVLKKESKFAVARVAAATTLAAIAQGDNEAAKALREYLTDPEPAVRCRVAYSLWLIEQNIMDTVPVLAEVVSNPKAMFYYREQAAHVLGRMGPAATVAVPALIQCLHDNDPQVRQFAGQALRQVDAEAATVGPI